MTPLTIKVSKEFFGIWLTMEASIIPNEDTTQAYTEVEKLIDNYYESRMIGKPPVTNGEEKVINRLHDRMEAIIENCSTIEQLAKHKEYCNNNPDLMPSYMNKLKQLNGKVHE